MNLERDVVEVAERPRQRVPVARRVEDGVQQAARVQSLEGQREHTRDLLEMVQRRREDDEIEGPSRAREVVTDLGAYDVDGAFPRGLLGSKDVEQLRRDVA